MKSLISIIVPVYNAEKYIVSTIESVRAQTYDNWELILVDDKSPDASADVIREYMDDSQSFVSEVSQLLEVDTHTDAGITKCPCEIYRWTNKSSEGSVVLCRKKENAGAALARNTGLSIATGRYIAFLDADDLWLPDRLAKGMELMTRSQVGFVYSAYEFGDEQAKGTGRIVHVKEKLSFKKALSRTIIFTTTTLFDTEIIPVSLLNMPQIASEDTATWWRILKAGYTAYGIDEVLAIYRRPAASLSSNKLVALKRIWDLYRKIAGLSVVTSAFYFVGWAIRATLRRV